MEILQSFVAFSEYMNFNTRGQLPENVVDPKVKVSKSWKQIMASSILPKNERNSLRSTFSTHDSVVHFLEESRTQFFFRDLLTFSWPNFLGTGPRGPMHCTATWGTFNDARVIYYDNATA